MTKFETIKSGYVFRYSSGTYMLVYDQNNTRGVPYDVMLIPQWVNRSHFVQEVLDTLATQWLTDYAPVTATESETES